MNGKLYEDYKGDLIIGDESYLVVQGTTPGRPYDAIQIEQGDEISCIADYLAFKHRGKDIYECDPKTFDDWIELLSNCISTPEYHIAERTVYLDGPGDFLDENTLVRKEEFVDNVYWKLEG